MQVTWILCWKSILGMLQDRPMKTFQFTRRCRATFLQDVEIKANTQAQAIAAAYAQKGELIGSDYEWNIQVQDVWTVTLEPAPHQHHHPNPQKKGRKSKHSGH